MNKIHQKLNKAKEMPIDILLKKITQKASERIFSEWKSIKFTVKPPNISREFFPFYETDSIFFIRDNQYDEVLKQIELLGKSTEIIEQANRICQHEFDLLGSGTKRLGKSIPWNKDFKADYYWPNKYYKKIQIIDLGNFADVKVPWELSRFQHIFTLGKAYQITNDEKYAFEFREQIQDWIHKNPVEMTVNWTCTMDVAIRAVNWIAGYHLFKKSKVIKADFWNLFNNMLYQHGKYIIDNLENRGTHTGNHYLSNLVGLIWLGIYFKSLKLNYKFKKYTPSYWLKFGLIELQEELFVQVNTDGTNYEASTSYHRLVSELFLLTTLFCNINKHSFPKDFNNRLEKMFDFLMHLTKPNGFSPIIGDADDGRLIITSDYFNWKKNDFRHLLAIAGEYFNRDDFRNVGSLFQEDAIWVNGSYKESSTNFKNLKTVYFPDGGYYILKNSNIYCCIRCGELSFRGEGVHSHNDQLSFDLTVKGEDFIIDPGSYVYTSDYKSRNLYRSTSMHNTLQIDNLEQNDFDEDNLFYMKEQTFSECKEIGESNFIGEHYGYSNKSGHIHSRKITIAEEALEIVDQVYSNTAILKKSLYKYYYTLDVGVAIVEIDEGLLLRKNGVEVLMIFEEVFSYSIQKVYVSKSYGLKESSNQIIIKTYKDNIKTQFKF